MLASGTVSPLVVEPLDKSRHNRMSFSCGVPALDEYLWRQAAQDMEKRAAVVYVALSDDSSIVGFYTLSQHSVELLPLPEDVVRRLARYPVVSATLLGRLAVASRLHGQRFGRALLFDALGRTLTHSAQIASAGVVVDAKDEQAATFYSKYGFVPMLGSDRRLFLSMKSIERMF
ncbi:MAG: GNAT family N-acetyltransferase [Terracidiphilus sp.]